jgi:hypothetical protein
MIKKMMDNDTVWGGYYLPGKTSQNSAGRLKIVLFGSAIGGQLILESLIRFQMKKPRLINIVGMVTDDPVDPRAKISLKKRIWSNYTPAESELLRDRIITTSLEAGIPCYTGKVKTGFFRKIYREWAPDVLIMNCFGQKLDDVLYNSPPDGAYNFHPSNLTCNIGVGAQPFHDIMRNGLDTSPIVIHKVTEIIDAGPVIGISPEINLRLREGSYPATILPLLYKMNSITGWMSIELLLEILNRKSATGNGIIEHLDFENLIPVNIRQILMTPATDNLNEYYTLPLHPQLL